MIDNQRSPFLLLPGLLLSLMCPVPCFADSGELALAVPVSRISVDGDLSDWPEDMRWYAVEKPEYGSIPVSASDLDGSFCVGYDTDALYIAVRVVDDSTIVNQTTRWYSQDGCSVYLDTRHSEADDDVVQFNIYGNGARDLQADIPGTAEWNCRRSNGVHTYEWKIDISSQRPSKLRPGVVLGFDVSICDKDRDRTFSWVSWGHGTEKHLSSSRLGDLLLIERDAASGRVTGRVAELDESRPLGDCPVSLHHDGMLSPISVRADGDGEIEVELPAGWYEARVSPDSRGVSFRVSREQPAVFEIQAPASTGKSVPVSSGKPQRVTKKTRMGALHGYTWPDALRWETVTGLTQDDDGALWIAGSSGLVRFDGTTITPMFDGDRLASTSLTIAVDHRGDIWSGTAIGLYRCDGKTMQYYGRSQGLLAGSVRQVVPHSDGSVFIRTDLGVCRFSGNRLRSIFETRDRVGELTCLAVESSIRVWLGTDNGLIRLDFRPDGNWHEHRIGVKEGLPVKRVNALLAGRDGELWIGGKETLCRYDGMSFYSWKPDPEKLPGAVIALTQTSDGRLWLGTTDGIAEFRDDQITHVADVRSVRTLFVDREDNLWIGADSLFRLDPYQARTPPEFSVANSRNARKLLLAKDGTLWVGTLRGVFQYQHGEKSYEYTQSCLEDEEKPGGKDGAALLEDSRGGIWIGTRLGLRYVKDGSTLSIEEKDGLSSSRVTALTEDRRGRIWIGTDEGITIYERPDDEEDLTEFPAGTFSHLTTSHGLPSSHIGALYTDSDGSVWIGSPYGKLCRFYKNSIRQFDDPVGVECLIRTSDGLFAGADGLYRFENDTWRRIDVCGRAAVRRISPGEKGTLWLATGAGLKVYNGFASHSFSRDDGLREYCWDAVWDKQRRQVVVAASHVSTYQPQTHAPSVRITGIQGESEYDSTSSVRFGVSDSSTTIAFHGTSYSTGQDALRYRYRIVGLDDSWKLTSQSEVTPGRLPPGKYTFEVSAINRDLIYSKSPASVSIQVYPEYLRMAVTALLTIAVAAVVILSFLVVRRTRQIHALNRNLEIRVAQRTAALELEVAEKKKLHDHLLQTQKLDAIGTLASGVAHDFNNSLAAITGFAEVAKIQWPESPELLDHILAAADQAAGTSRNLLAFSRGSEGERKPCDLGPLVEETGSFLRQSLPASVNLDVTTPDENSDNPLICSIDESRIQQVLVNIVLNARDALEGEGSIQLSLQECSLNPKFARLVVSDDGPGMPEDVRKRIFEPFFTTKARGRGTGLGMAMVHGIIHDHQGMIDVDSSPGAGTTVSILLPRSADSIERFEPIEREYHGCGQKILVAEDNPDVCHMLVCQLASCGYEVLTAEDGQVALQLLEQAARDIHVVLLDIDLPKKDGLSCLEEIRATYPGMRIILMSGLASIEREQFDAPFLRKPFTQRDLLSAVDVILDSDSVAA